MELTPFRSDAESLAAHRQRLGPLPTLPPDQLIAELEASGLLGRGGAGFPVGCKWRSVAERSSGGAVVLVNGAEGEPLSQKDRTLMASRPHLVIDGALLAARAAAADDIIFYIGLEHRAADAALRRALAERSADIRGRVRIVDAPAGYVSGEESAAVHFVDAGDARPTPTPPRPFERGVRGRPTLVQNVESLALAALIARRGHDWYRGLGLGQAQVGPEPAHGRAAGDQHPGHGPQADVGAVEAAGALRRLPSPIVSVPIARRLKNVPERLGVSNCSSVYPPHKTSYCSPQ